MLGSANALVAADGFGGVRHQTASDRSSIGHAADNGSFRATGVIVVGHRDVLEAAVGDAARATQTSGDGARLSIVLLVADSNVLYAETRHRASEVSKETYLSSCGRDDTILDGMSATVVVACKACLAGSQGDERATLQVNVGYLLDINIGVVGCLDIFFHNIQIISIFYPERIVCGTLSQLTDITRHDRGREVQTIEVILTIRVELYRHLITRTQESTDTLLDTVRRADEDISAVVPPSRTIM